MRSGSSVVGRALGALALVFAGAASAAQEAQLVESINHYRGEVRSCAGESYEALPALSADPRLAVSPRGGGDLQRELSAAAYPLINVQAISLSGPRDAQAAMKVLQESYCRILLDPQFVDIGVTQEGRDWRVVLARPLLSGKLGDWQESTA